MLNTFNQLTPHLRFKAKIITIDNLAFRFHYRGTFIILLVCTILVTSRQYIGEHIRCMSGANTIPEHVINSFCFFTSTFTVVRHLNETQLQKNAIPHPGIGPLYEGDQIKRHAYYQWVPFVLFFQALCFYLPHMFWRKCENGKIKSLVSGLQKVLLTRYLARDENLKLEHTVIMSKGTVDGKVTRIKLAFLKHLKVNQAWAYKLILCEILNLLNVLFQIWFTNMFLSGHFYDLGLKFIRDDFKGIMDSLDIVFPKVTKCHFYKYGPSGSIQKHDALCVMALNVINEKIFVFLWFWYCILIFISVIALMWRMVTLLLHSRSAGFNAFVFSFACPGRMNPWEMLTVTRECYFSDWLFLYYLAKNMEPYLFREMLIDIARELESAKNSRNPSLSQESFESNDVEVKFESENESDMLKDYDDHSLNSDDMYPTNYDVIEKRVKFA